MSEHLSEFWAWMKTAPLPVVIALNIIIGAWVWNLAGDQRVGAAHVEAVVKQVDGIDTKLDRLLDGMAELKAEQRQVRRELQASHNHSKEK